MTGMPEKQSDAGFFSITLERVQDYEFRVKFDKAQFQELMLDEPPPLGKDAGPNASRLLAAAVGNCLSASLAFCSQKSRVPLHGLNTKVDVRLTRNEKGRLRIGNIDVEIEPVFEQVYAEKAKRCLGLFEDYCTVSQSFRAGIPISVSVKTAQRPHGYPKNEKNESRRNPFWISTRQSGYEGRIGSPGNGRADSSRYAGRFRKLDAGRTEADLSALPAYAPERR
jgi:uncharacterized OsmC-like protein